MDELFKLLEEKNKLLKDFLDYVSNNSFQEAEEEIPKILAYVDEKQSYIDKLSELETKIKAIPRDGGDYKEVKAAEKKNDNLIRDIVGLDKININTMNNLKEKLKLNMKGAKIQQKYVVSYGNYAMDIRGSRFDGKQ